MFCKMERNMLYVFIFRNGFKKYVSIVEKKSLIEFIY